MTRNAIVYLSKGGSTQRVAERIRECLPGTSWLFELEQFQNEDPTDFNFLFFGSPTYGLGELDYRWLKYLRNLDVGALRDSSTSVALFVLGDQKWHGKTFAGSLVDFARPFRDSEMPLLGAWPSDTYNFEGSRAVDSDGNFPGLVIDEVSQPDLTEPRIKRWLGSIFADVQPPAAPQTN